MLLGFVFFFFSLGYVTCAVPNVSCTIMNLEYIDCSWSENGIPEFNYTFQSSLKNKDSFRECPTYLQEGAHTVGCRLPYEKGNKFDRLFSNLSLDNSFSWNEQEIDLQNRVKLMPPHNLSVERQSGSELWLYWNISAPSDCMESEVSYRKNTDQVEKTTGELPGKSFSLPFPSENYRYTFRVRTRVMDSCFRSNWSAWSTPVYWGEIKGNSTSTEPNDGHSMNWLTFVIAVVGCVLFVAVFVGFLFQNERLRVILIPIVPNPSKTLDELLYTYNGNVEDWLHISHDFVAGFKPNFSEPACPVQEYSLVPQTSLSGSEGSLPVLFDESDCLYTSCSTSNSSIPSSPANTPPGLV
ncbi:cytokine receptor common subunit gamma-like isoform X1 [Anguilla anguilla]|uniref:Fibronectin type-III domain-containing protein n=1 Tax=Anguilla anguilla TaxID=7936 RepID=A0A9D3RUH3_ANGAN|nr:cytokine receptor common subunit gamma-like isoform X1 [Anguilla anguilla]KAG5843538.1 hypothetical protein ANANG_G00151970 [Anguilla anguilla]